MIPILYPATETAFDSNGLGMLADATDCTVNEELNTSFELVLKYPVSGALFGDLALRTIILADVDPVSEPQPFRVYRITKPAWGMVTVYAQHIAYDLMGVVIPPFKDKLPVTICTMLEEHCPGFTFWTDLDTEEKLSVTLPTTAWDVLSAVVSRFGSEIEFDRFTAKLHTRRGMDRGVTIRYGKNLSDLTQEENCAACYTAVYPYWSDGNGNVTYLPGSGTVEADGDHGYTRVLPLDLSDRWETAPTDSQLRQAAEEHIADNDIGKPEVSLNVSFVQLEQTEEYKGLGLLERVLLSDTVSVIFPALGVDVAAKAVAICYKPLLDRYDSITLGSIRSGLEAVVVSNAREIEKRPVRSQIKNVSAAITNALIGATGGAVRLLDNDGDGLPDTLYIADDPDPNLAKKVWRYNYEGWGASKTGYNGPFTMGATLDDGLLADFITTGKIKAANIDVTDLVVKALQTSNNDSLININGGQISIEGQRGGYMQLVSLGKPEIHTEVEDKVAWFTADLLQFSKRNANNGSITMGVLISWPTIDGEEINTMSAPATKTTRLWVNDIEAEWKEINGVRTLVAKGDVI